MMAEDRKIRLIGYEVYRFGGWELARHDAAYETLLLLQSFLQGPHAADHLEAIRGEAGVDDEVVDALKTLHWQIQKRRMEQATKPRRVQADDSLAAAAGGE